MAPHTAARRWWRHGGEQQIRQQQKPRHQSHWGIDGGGEQNKDGQINTTGGNGSGGGGTGGNGTADVGGHTGQKNGGDDSAKKLWPNLEERKRVLQTRGARICLCNQHKRPPYCEACTDPIACQNHKTVTCAGMGTH